MQTFAALIGLAESIQTSLLAQFSISVEKTHVKRIGFWMAIACFFGKKLQAS